MNKDIARIKIIEEHEPGDYPLEIIVSRKLLLEAVEQITPSEDVRGLEIKKIIRAIIMLVLAATIHPDWSEIRAEESENGLEEKKYYQPEDEEDQDA